MTGNPGSERSDPLFLLDESLSPKVARALALVGYKISPAIDVFRRKGVKDPEIIKWCEQNGVIWVHADDRAKRQHGKLIRTSGIRTLWIRRKGGAMIVREQLRIISYAFPQLMHNYGEQPETLHYSVSAADEMSNPALMPEEI